MRVHSEEMGSSPALSRHHEKNKGRSTERTDRGDREQTAEHADEANQMIVQAEQFKAAVEKPKGNVPQIISQLPAGLTEVPELQTFNQYFKQLLDNDDDEFFHLTCHIEPSLKSKIESGQYVELERLLPRSRSQIIADEQKFQMINKNGYSYWIPAD